MLCKAIVEDVISANSARVRIPIYHQISSASYATKFQDLPIASICTPPGISYALKIGDVVFVDFEMDQQESPVIIGMLARDDMKSSSNIETQSLNVKINCNLPKDTYFTKEEEIKDINMEQAMVETMENGLSVARFG